MWKSRWPSWTQSNTETKTEADSNHWLSRVCELRLFAARPNRPTSIPSFHSHPIRLSLITDDHLWGLSAMSFRPPPPPPPPSSRQCTNLTHATLIHNKCVRVTLKLPAGKGTTRISQWRTDTTVMVTILQLCGVYFWRTFLSDTNTRQTLAFLHAHHPVYY